MKKPSSLALALRESGAKVAASTLDLPEQEKEQISSLKMAQQSRVNTKPITVHYPEEVRRQLKILAAEKGRMIDDMVAEALNLLFVKYSKPEIAPRKVRS